MEWSLSSIEDSPKRFSVGELLDPASPKRSVLDPGSDSSVDFTSMLKPYEDALGANTGSSADVSVEPNRRSSARLLATEKKKTSDGTQPSCFEGLTKSEDSTRAYHYYGTGRKMQFAASVEGVTTYEALYVCQKGKQRAIARYMEVSIKHHICKSKVFCRFYGETRRKTERKQRGEGGHRRETATDRREKDDVREDRDSDKKPREREREGRERKKREGRVHIHLNF